MEALFINLVVMGDESYRVLPEEQITQREMQAVDQGEGELIKFQDGHYWRAKISAADDARSMEWVCI